MEENKMSGIRILGIVGSPRKDGNTAKMVERALAGASAVTGVETEVYELAGKKIHHCIGCYKCLEKGRCVFEDDLYEFGRKYMEADGIIWGAPVYHMSIPASMKALLDRFGNMLLCRYLGQLQDVPRFNKVCGVLTNGASNYGGQDFALSLLINSCLIMNGIVVSGDTIRDSYIGAAAFTGQAPDPLAKDNVVKDEKGLACAESVGKRVAEMARIVKAGMKILKNELPEEYSYSRELI
jgi:multimeric flavodoxin WrbA